MYIRDFQCECGHVQEEVFESYVEYLEQMNKRRCLNCGDVTFPKLSGGNFSLKGGGWAKDGYGG